MRAKPSTSTQIGIFDMDGFELNKIVGALLGSVLVVMLIGFVAELVYHVEEPEVAGYSIDVPETETADAAAEPEETVSVLDLLATADVAAGESAVRRCASCHTFEEGGADGVGPHLYGVVNRPKGSVDGFNYSDAMQEVAAAGQVWGFEELDGFIANPRGYLEGTSMGFAGVRDVEDRADILAYLNTLQAEPVDLSTVSATQ
jgi:cytochrome c